MMSYIMDGTVDDEVDEFKDDHHDTCVKEVDDMGVVGDHDH